MNHRSKIAIIIAVILFVIYISLSARMDNFLFLGTGGGSIGFVGFEQKWDSFFIREDAGYMTPLTFSAVLKTGYDLINTEDFQWHLNAIGGIDGFFGETNKVGYFGGLGTGINLFFLFLDFDVVAGFGYNTSLFYQLETGIRLDFNFINYVFTGKKNIDVVRTSNKYNSSDKADELAADSLADVDNNIPQGTGGFGKDVIAIVIGNKDYQNNIPQVTFAINDADIFSDYLVKTFGIPRVNIRRKNNLTKANFDSLFGIKEKYQSSLLYKNTVIGKKDLIIYYSGHGAPGIDNGKGYLVPIDGDVMSMDITGYAIDTMFDNIRKIQKEGYIGKIWVVFDCCFSGDSGGGKLLKNISPVALKIDNPLMVANESMLMFSSSGSEVSSWFEKKKHGLFTYFLLKGVGGDADKNHDGIISLADLKSYLGDMVPRWAIHETGQQQNPQILTKDDSQVLLKLNR